MGWSISKWRPRKFCWSSAKQELKKCFQNSDEVETWQRPFIFWPVFYNCDLFVSQQRRRMACFVVSSLQTTWFFFSTVNIPLSSQTLLQIFFCSYLKTSALASITWTPFIFPQEEASMLRDIMNARRLFLYRERTAMISSTRKYGSNAVFSHSVYSCFDKRCPTKVSTKV